MRALSSGLGEKKSEYSLMPALWDSMRMAALLCPAARASSTFAALAAMLAAVCRGVVLPLTENLRLFGGGGSSKA